MAPPPDLLETLTTLTSSISTTTLAFNSQEFPSLQPPENGISLLDLKNELLLSYLHNVVFLVLVRLRSGSLGSGPGSDVVRELAKIRVLLERGVKPLEGKLKYQIDKVIAAATDEGTQAQAQVPAKTKNTKGGKSDEDENEDEIDHDDYGDYSHRATTTLSAAPVSATAKRELAFRPNPAALSRPSAPALSAGETAKDGIYRPPRISATAMPESSKPSTKRSPHKKSHMLDEFIADELSTAPLAEPSIGSTIIASGRVVKTTRDRREEAERQEYEESNFVRLPKMSKKEARELKRRRGREANGLGGEDWTSFAGDVDRLTKGVDRVGKSSQLLEKSRKRAADEIGGGGVSRSVGESFERKKNRLAKRRKA